jgi:hypothetical protein
MTQHAALLKITMRAGEDRKGCITICGREYDAKIPGGGPSPRKFLNFRDFLGLQTHLPRIHFYYISVIIR